MLEAEKIKQNWEMYRDRVNDLFPTRKDQLNKMYDDFEDRLAMMPASSMAHFHNAFAGGYIDHVLRVMDCTETLYDVWFHQGADMSGYTKEELMFAAMHHDLGKVGFPGDGNEVYQIETSDWKIFLSLWYQIYLFGCYKNMEYQCHGTSINLLRFMMECMMIQINHILLQDQHKLN